MTQSIWIYSIFSKFLALRRITKSQIFLDTNLDIKFGYQLARRAFDEEA